MSLDTELGILQGMIENDPKAWGAFYERYNRLIYRCITAVTSKFTDVVAHEDIAEIFNDVTVSLLKNDKRRLRTYDPDKGSRLGSWVGYVAVSCAYDFLRALRKGPECSCSELTEGCCGFGIEAVEAREQVNILSRRLQLLSERDQEFVRLYWFEDMSAADVAQRMDVTVATVYTKKHKVRAKLEGLCADFT